MKGLSPDHTALIALVTAHKVVCVVGNGEDVGWELADLHVLVLLDVAAVVNVKKLVRVHGNENRAGVRLIGG